MRSARVCLLLALACEPTSRPPTTPAAPTPSAEPAPGPTPHTRTRPFTRTCPVDPKIIKPTTVQIDPRIDLGEIDGVRWLFGYSAGDAVLAHLAADGTLAFNKVPLHNAQAGAVEGPRIWLYAPKESADIPTRWTSIDVRDPDRPVTGDVVPLTVNAKLDYAATLAVGTRRALVITGVPDERELVLLDTTTRAPVRPPHPLGKGFEPIHSFCDTDRCAVVAISDEGGGPSRRLVVNRVLADGALEHAQLAPDWIGQPHAATLGDQILVAWPDHDGLKVRALDRWGHPVGPTTSVPWDSNKYIQHTALLHGPGGVMLGIGERGRWSVALVGRNAAVSPLHQLPGATRYFLFGAPLDDGLAWVNLGGDVSYDEMGPGVMTHSWHAEAVGGFFVSTSSAPADPPRPLTSGAGGGRGGFDPYMLTRPDAAAALIVPRGDADDFSAPMFALLRARCL